VKDILIIGNLDPNPKVINGQTTRSRKVAAMLRQRFGDEAISSLDLSIPKAQLFTQFFMKVFRCRQIVLLGGARSLPVFLGLLLICGRLPATTMVAIGGWLGDLADRNRLIRKIALPRVAHIFVQTSLIRDAVLRSVPNARVSVMPNFNLTAAAPDDDPDRFVRHPLRLIFLSQLRRSKGVFLAIDAVRTLHQIGTAVTLDIFGPFAEDGVEEELMAALGPGIRYRGVVPAEQVVEVMTRYDVFVFPTFYTGEGFPGVIMDAFCSGTPIVCSDWKSNSALVSDGRTGLLFALDTPGALVSALLRLMEDRNLLRRISMNARAEARKYQPETVAAPFLDHLAVRLNLSTEPAR
jgi:glycosyltransferase involved in cell wall biosynthesis